MLGKELTKPYETIITGTISDVRHTLATVPIKGEWTVAMTLKQSIDDRPIEAALHEMMTAGCTRSQVVHLLKTVYNVPKTPSA